MLPIEKTEFRIISRVITRGDWLDDQGNNVYFRDIGKTGFIVEKKGLLFWTNINRSMYSSLSAADKALARYISTETARQVEKAKHPRGYSVVLTASLRYGVEKH